MANQEQIIEAIKEMSVLELNDLVKAIEEEFGVTAAAPVAAAGAAGGGDAAAEKTEFDVELTSAGSSKIKVVKAVKEAKIEDFKFHDLRHCAASYLAMNGATLVEIAQILGHKTLQMVKRYSHLTEQHTAKVVAKMNKEIFK